MIWQHNNEMFRKQGIADDIWQRLLTFFSSFIIFSKYTYVGLQISILLPSTATSLELYCNRKERPERMGIGGSAPGKILGLKCVCVIKKVDMS